MIHLVFVFVFCFLVVVFFSCFRFLFLFVGHLYDVFGSVPHHPHLHFGKKSESIIRIYEGPMTTYKMTQRLRNKKNG